MRSFQSDFSWSNSLWCGFQTQSNHTNSTLKLKTSVTVIKGAKNSLGGNCYKNSWAFLVKAVFSWKSSERNCCLIISWYQLAWVKTRLHLPNHFLPLCSVYFFVASTRIAIFFAINQIWFIANKIITQYIVDSTYLYFSKFSFFSQFGWINYSWSSKMFRFCFSIFEFLGRYFTFLAFLRVDLT